jgi:hypothetical protein
LRAKKSLINGRGRNFSFCAGFPDETEAREFAEELAKRLSEVRKVRGGYVVVKDEQGDTLCEITVLRQGR